MEYDSPWKEAIEDMFEAFLFFFFPDIHKAIDFSKGYEFRDKELQKIIRSSQTGRRYTDKLVKVYLLDGSETWLLIHIEIQGYEQKEFPERMFVYYYRIFDKFKKEVVSLALLTDDNPNFRPNEYRQSRWNCEVVFRYPLVKIIDYRNRWAELEANPQPFAIIVKAYLRALETAGNMQERYTWKKRFLLELYRSGLKRETILAIYKFIDWVMQLTEELENELHEVIKSTEETTQMPHITTAERIGIKKGIDQGIEQSLNSFHRVIATLIKMKFGESGLLLTERAQKVQRLELLEAVAEQLMLAQTAAEAEKIFNEVETPNGP